jgi:hypothetical protein
MRVWKLRASSWGRLSDDAKFILAGLDLLSDLRDFKRACIDESGEALASFFPKAGHAVFE